MRQGFDEKTVIVTGLSEERRGAPEAALLYRETEELYHHTTISPQLCELRNLITIGYLVTRSAALRKESRGLHFTTDFPGKLAHLESTLL